MIMSLIVQVHWYQMALQQNFKRVVYAVEGLGPSLNFVRHVNNQRKFPTLCHAHWNFDLLFGDLEKIGNNNRKILINNYFSI